MGLAQGKITVGVLRGGPSPEYEVSLKTGAHVLKKLPEQYQGKDIFIDQKGVWHLDGFPREPHRILKHMDVVFNALHGAYGEDGTVQQILDTFKVPYTGAKTYASALCMNKHLSKKVYRAHDLKTPYHEILRRDNISHSRLFGVYANLKKPVVVKPATAGSSIGVSIVSDWSEFSDAVALAFQYSDSVLAEEYIEGREATCAVVDSGHKRGEVYALAPIEIIPAEKGNFFDYNAKYSGKTQEICPGNFSPEQTKEIQDMAIVAHKALEMRHYSRSDFIVTPDTVYILETNSLPGLTDESLLPKALTQAGIAFREFLEHVLVLALRYR